MPQLFMSLMKVFEKKWRGRGIQVFVYLDDILLLGSSPGQVENHLKVLVADLLESGFLINLKKSCLAPAQKVQHLGFLLDLEEGRLQVCPQKLKHVRKELGKLVLKKMVSCRKMAAILGQVRSFLVAVPFLRAFTDIMCNFVAQSEKFGWDHVGGTPRTKEANFGSQRFAFGLGRKALQFQCKKVSTLRFLRRGWGLQPLHG